MESTVLKRIGLTQNESIVYLSLLPLGTARTSSILKQSGLNSGKIYEILDSLKAKGLVSESVINGVKHFTTAPPRELLTYIEQKKQNIRREEQTVLTALPELEQLRQTKRVCAQAATYLGYRGIRTAADEALSSLSAGEDILVMGATEQKARVYNTFWKQWAGRRTRQNIRARMLFSERGAYFTSFKQMKLTDCRVLTGLTPVAVDVFGRHSVLLLNYTEPPSCILIYDKNAAQSFRQFFEQLWAVAKP